MKKTLFFFFLIILSFQQVKAQTKPNVITNDSSQKNTLPFYEVVTNFSNLLDGALPGVQVSNSVRPGASGTILLRGIHSLDNKDAPLIVIDGAPYFADINTININDIQSIKLLKGPEASGIYGFRGVNGVIEVRTKKAKDKKTHLTVDAAIGINNRAFPGYDVLTSEKDFYETAWDALHNTLVEQGMNSAEAAQFSSQSLISMLGGYNSYSVPDSEVINPLTGKLNPAAQLKYHDDWRKALQRTALRHDYNISASKAGKKGTLFFSAGYLNDGGYIKHTGYERLTGRLNGNFNFTSWLKAGLNICGATSTTDMNDPSALSNPFYAMQNLAPIYPVYDYDAAGNRTYDPITGTDKLNWGYGGNVLGSLILDKNRYKQSNIRAIPYIQLHFLKHFSLSSHFFYNYYKDAFEGAYNPYYGVGAGVGGIKNSLDLKNRNYIWTQDLSWDRELGQHHLALSIGHENDKRNIEQAMTTTVFNGNSSSQYELKFKSLFGQFHYGFKDKYHFHAALRRDVNEQAFVSMREQMSWSAGASWKINRENLLRQSRNINLLKINVDYGKSNRSGKLISRKLDIGMEFAFFQNRLSGYLDYFNRRDDNRNIYFPSAPSTGIPGFNLPFDLGTQGLELNLKGMLVQRKNFSWWASLNLGHYTNKILTMPESIDSIIGPINILTAGISPQSYYLVESAGVDPQTGNALYYYRDANGQKKTTTDYSMAAVKGEELAGTMTPDVFGGFSNTVAYKHFEFSFRLTFALGGKYYDYNYQQLMQPSWGQNWSTDILNHWTPENRNTNVPKPDVSNAGEGSNTRFLSSASWLNVNNVSLTYHFNNRELSHLHLSSLSLYISATNLWMFSARKGMNPQASLYDNANDLYAPARTIMLGIHAGL